MTAGITLVRFINHIFTHIYILRSHGYVLLSIKAVISEYSITSYCFADLNLDPYLDVRLRVSNIAYRYFFQSGMIYLVGAGGLMYNVRKHADKSNIKFEMNWLIEVELIACIYLSMYIDK